MMKVHSVTLTLSFLSVVVFSPVEASQEEYSQEPLRFWLAQFGGGSSDGGFGGSSDGGFGGSSSAGGSSGGGSSGGGSSGGDMGDYSDDGSGRGHSGSVS